MYNRKARNKNGTWTNFNRRNLLNRASKMWERTDFQTFRWLNCQNILEGYCLEVSKDVNAGLPGDYVKATINIQEAIESLNS